MKYFFLLVLVIVSALQTSAQDSTHNDSIIKLIDSPGINVVDSADLYGLIPQRPILVGGGPVNQRYYLESLRDPRGRRISFVRLGSCCAYETSSFKAMFGKGLLDVYEITYRDIKKQKQKLKLYISFYDYEELRPIKGFTID